MYFALIYDKSGKNEIGKRIQPSGRAIHVPRISTQIKGEFQGIIPAEISSLFPCGNLGEMKGNFLCGYFCFLSLWNPWGYFHVEISLISSLKNFKMQFNYIGRVPVMWKYASVDLMSSFGEFKCSQVWGNYLLISIPFKNFPWISMWILVSVTTQISTWIPSTSNNNPWGFPTECARFCPLG